MSEAHRIERDSIGPVHVPQHVYYGAHTQRAREFFQMNGQTIGRSMIRAFGLVKKAAAETNKDLGLLTPAVADAIIRATDEVILGKLDGHFPLSVYQDGAGAAAHINANEVIANKAIEILGGTIGSRLPAHPEDHVNLQQSTNDVFPTVIHVALALQSEESLTPALEEVYQRLDEKSVELNHIFKSGRVHLMDALPIRLGQEFSGYASQMAHGIERVTAAQKGLLELPIGGREVGTGFQRHPEFASRVVSKLSLFTGVKFRESQNHFEAQSARDAVVHFHGAIKTVACALIKIASDIRLMASGPRTGFAEIRLPEILPPAATMPGNVNPMLIEMLLQACARVLGNDVTVAFAGSAGQFELNAMMPVMGYTCLESMDILSFSLQRFGEKCIRNITADAKRCLDYVDKNLSRIAALTHRIGAETAAKIVREALNTGRNLREILLEKNILSADKLNDLFNLDTMTEPG